MFLPAGSRIDLPKLSRILDLQTYKKLPSISPEGLDTISV